MQPSPGNQTSEYKSMIRVQVAAVVGGVISLLVVFGVVAAEDAAVILAIAVPAVIAVVTLVLAFTSAGYNKGRVEVKVAAAQNGHAAVPELHELVDGDGARVVGE